VQIFIQKSTVQGGWHFTAAILKAHSLYPINVKTKFSKTKGTTLCMSCPVKAVSGGRHAGRQAVMIFNAASLRDFAAFSFCRLPSFTVVHPSVHHRFTLFRR
jgi:hypothetical protein